MTIPPSFTSKGSELSQRWSWLRKCKQDLITLIDGVAPSGLVLLTTEKKKKHEMLSSLGSGNVHTPSLS